MSDIATPLVVGLVLSAFYVLPPACSPASFVLVLSFITPLNKKNSAEISKNNENKSQLSSLIGGRHPPYE